MRSSLSRIGLSPDVFSAVMATGILGDLGTSGLAILAAQAARYSGLHFWLVVAVGTWVAAMVLYGRPGSSSGAQSPSGRVGTDSSPTPGS